MLARRRSRVSAEPAAGETAVVALERARMVLVVLAPGSTAPGDVGVPTTDHLGPSARAICLGIYPALQEPLGDICSDPGYGGQIWACVVLMMRSCGPATRHTQAWGQAARRDFCRVWRGTSLL